MAPILDFVPGPWGIAIKQLRLAKGWTRAEVARRAKMTPTTFGRIESGNHTVTTKLRDIADAFQVSIDDVLVPAVSRTSEAARATESELRRTITQIVLDVLASARPLLDAPRGGSQRDRIQRIIEELDREGERPAPRVKRRRKRAAGR